MQGEAAHWESDLPIRWFGDERTLLAGFLDAFRALDPDLLLGWNLINFDLDYLQRRCRLHRLPFAFGRGSDDAAIVAPQRGGQTRFPSLPGRVALDGIDTLRAAFWSFESFELGFVAERLLGRRKLIEEPTGKIEEIRRLFREDRPALAAYNLEDCRLVEAIFEIEAQGYRVIYGDTDSVFVLLGPDYAPSDSRQVGESLAASLNRWWQEIMEREFRLKSFLEIEFETHFHRFLMPTIRGAETGSKKRYAGTVQNAKGEFELIFKGLESVRSDWTPLAQSFQRELYRRVFLREPWEGFVGKTVAQLKSGVLDDQLVYRKRLRQPLAAYRRNIPPHVQAARKLANPGRVIRYLITINGPEPVSARTSAIDYQHYLDRQLAPVADGILHFLGDSFARLTAKQLELYAPH